MENILDNTLIDEQNEKIVYGGFLPRLGALFLDALIFSPIYICTFYNLLNWKSSILMVLFTLIPVIYKPFWEYKFGTTIGKKAFSLRVTNLNFEKPNLQEALLRNIFYILFPVLNILFYLSIFNTPEFADITKFSEFSMINQLSKGMVLVSYSSGLISLVEFVMIIADKKKRTLHDRIGQTYVIKQKRYWETKL